MRSHCSSVCDDTSARGRIRCSSVVACWACLFACPGRQFQHDIAVCMPRTAHTSPAMASRSSPTIPGDTKLCLLANIHLGRSIRFVHTVGCTASNSDGTLILRVTTDMSSGCAHIAWLRRDLRALRGEHVRLERSRADGTAGPDAGAPQGLGHGVLGRRTAAAAGHSLCHRGGAVRSAAHSCAACI